MILKGMIPMGHDRPPRHRQVSLLAQFLQPEPVGWDPTGPPVAETVKQLIDSLWTNPIKNQAVEELYGTLPRPSILDTLRTTIVNEEVVRSLPPCVRGADRELATIQWATQFAACPLVSILDKLERGQLVDKSDMIQAMVSTLRLLGRSCWLSNKLRREMVRPHLRGPFQTLANNDGPQGLNNLFGDDLPGRIKDTIEARNMTSEITTDKLPG